MKFLIWNDKPHDVNHLQQSQNGTRRAMHPKGVDKVGTKDFRPIRFKVAQFWIPLEPSRLKHNMATPEEVT
jgi:hypothetical protein